MKWCFFWWLSLSLVFHNFKSSQDSNESSDSHEDSSQSNQDSHEDDIASNTNESSDSHEDSSQSNQDSHEDDIASITNENNGGQQNSSPTSCHNPETSKPTLQEVRCRMEVVNTILYKGRDDDSIKAVKDLEELLEKTEVDNAVTVHVDSLVAFLCKPKSAFQGLEMYASEEKVTTSNPFNANTKVRVQLPRELDPGPNNTLVFCMISGSQTNRILFGTPEVLYDNRLIGLSVGNKNISGLQQRVNITMNLTIDIQETQNLMCAFYDFETRKYGTDGCQTLWAHGQSQITCSCDHLTYFGVLLISADISSRDEEILTYITLIGCSLSLFALVITVFLFIINRNVIDVSMKIHINLVIALIVLNTHFLPSKAVAALSSTWLCFYFAVCIHYSLLASFSWMALEGFHIYLLIVRVFNIYINRYLLKLAVVGWGVPAVIVSLVLIIDVDAYGQIALDSSNANSTLICYITDDTVKMVTTVGVFGLVFIFNVCLFALTVKRLLTFRHGNESKNARVMRDICTLVGLTILLGISWGLIFFSFGYLTIPGLYIFCILNSLQGFFIFLWFLMSLRKKKNSVTKTSRDTNSTNN